MIKKLLFIAGLVATMSGLSLQATAQTAALSNHGDGGVKVPAYSSRHELGVGRQLMSQDVKATDERTIYPTNEGFFIRFVSEKDKTVEIAPAQTAQDKAKEGIYYKDVVIPETLHVKKGTDEVIPCTVVAVGQAAFALTDVYTVQYPATCKELKDRVFRLASLKECVIPDQIEKVGDNVFIDCKEATKVVIGKGLKAMGETPFINCQNLKDITVSPDNTFLTVQDTILYSKDMSKLYLCPSERRVKVVLPNTVKEIEDYAFLSCIYVKELVLNEGLERIGEEGLYNCSWLEQLTIPASVREIAPRALGLLKTCEKITVAEGNKTFEAKSDGVNEGKLLINKVKNSLHTCLYKGTKNVTVPEGIKEIEPYAFLACRWTESLKLPASVETIGQTAFSEMVSLKEIEIPEKVQTIPLYCISDCKELTKITLGKNVKMIEDQAFAGNDTMEKKGGTLQILAVTPPAVGKDSEGTTYDMGKDFYKKVTLEVPAEAREAYKKDRNWKKFRRVYPVGNELVQNELPLQINVAGGVLSITAPEVAPIAIYTLDGQVVYTTSAQEAQLALPAGLYMVTYGTQATKVLVD